jgi:hypothetical protein
LLMFIAENSVSDQEIIHFQMISDSRSLLNIEECSTFSQ